MTPTQAEYWKYLARRGDMTAREVIAIVDELLAVQEENERLQARITRLRGRLACSHDEAWSDARFRTCAACGARWPLDESNQR